MPSIIAWLDASREDQRRMREIVNLFTQSESRDELGIGQVRDAFSDSLFPGTSTGIRSLRPVLNPIQHSYTWIGLGTQEEVSAIAEPELPTTFTFAEAEDRGLSRRRLQRLQATGAVERIGRGLYRRTDEELVDHDLIEVAAKAHQPTLCLVSALARHELTDVIPPVHDVAIPRGAWQPVMSAPVQWHKFALATFEVGRTTIPLDDVYAIGLYDAPRTIIDAFRLRHAVVSIRKSGETAC